MERPKPSGIVTLTTDFGTSDHYAGVLRGVILSRCPTATVVDLTHGVKPGAIEQGAFFLSQGYTAYPAGTVHAAVVDPGVGSDRRCLIAISNGHYFVGPDNGVLSHVLTDPGAVVIAVNVDAVLPAPASQTFHGRDLFAPLAARIVTGDDFSWWGTPIQDMVRLPSLEAKERLPGEWRGRVLNIDRFGNIVTNLPAGLVTGKFLLQVGSAPVNRLAATYEDAEDGELFAIVGSAGFLEVSVRGRSAALAAQASLGGQVDLRADPLS